MLASAGFTPAGKPSGMLWLACAVAALGIAPAQAQTTYPKGAQPYAGVIRDSAGNLYGTTWGGGSTSCGFLGYGCGVVYKLDTAGHEKVLYEFTEGADGGIAIAGVIGDPAGNLYGTTDYGGDMSCGCGVVYKLDTARQYTVLYTFTGGADGSIPQGGVIRDSAGNLYGTTYAGGTSGQGVVFKLDTAGQETVLYTFTGGADGGGPNAVIRDSAGNLYGTTGGGGTSGAGVVFKVDAAGHETVLYSFTGGADGGSPFAGVIRDSAGCLYGTTFGGGTASAGVVFKVDPAGRETVLYTFTGGADGGNPTAGVIRDPAGNLYGTTNSGGTGIFNGVVFKVDPAGQETVLYAFCSLTDCADGVGPYAGVIRDSANNLYGTTQGGGTSNSGTVYKLEPAGQAPWPETVLYSFPAVEQ
jgi:uncharacterized repeat protein (TIGR03803 family)